MNTIEKATCKTCGFYENNCPFIRGKFIPYPNKVCEDYTFSTLKAEQEPDKDLEEAAMNYIAPIENEDGLKVINFSGQDIKDAFIAGSEWRYQKDRAEFAKLKTKEWMSGYDEGLSKGKEQMMKIITKDDNLEEAGTQYVETYFRDIDWTPDVIKSCLEEAFISGGEYVFKQIKYE